MANKEEGRCEEFFSCGECEEDEDIIFVYCNRCSFRLHIESKYLDEITIGHSILFPHHQLFVLDPPDKTGH